MILRPAALVVLLITGCTYAASLADAARAAPGDRRAVLVSLDALSEARVFALSRSTAPNLQTLFAEGACAAYAVPAFPSVTASGHAAISTGAFGNVSGVAANDQPPLPRDRNRLTDREGGYLAGPLRAEPIWITAALAGLDVVSHHFPQAPQPPGYRPIVSGHDTLAGMRARAERALALPGTAVVNGYNQVFTRGLVIRQRTRPATGWAGMEVLPDGTLPPHESAWRVLDDSVYAVFYGVGRYSHARLALERDLTNSVEVVAMAADTTSPDGRPLARHFSGPIEISSDDGRVFLHARLFELAADGSTFMLFHPALGVVQANRSDISAEYDAAVPGWAGNGAWRLGADGFGTSLNEGGDGTAEARYLETLEFVTRKYMAGAEWAWQERRPHLLVDYFPVADEIDHNLYGWLNPGVPGYDAALAARYKPYRDHAWRLVDLRLAHLMRLVDGDPDAALFVTGDHGMRPYWRLFRPNVALVRAGLLVLDEDARPDLSATRALSPNGYWISVNHTEWLDGIVSADSIATVIDAAEHALLAVRGPDGEQVVTRIWRTDDSSAAALGIGGPVGGDLYFELARGYYYSRQFTGSVVSDAGAQAGHGFPSTAPDMHTSLCGWGDSFMPVRTGAARIVDAAPTVADWLRIEPPPQSVGTSRLSEWRR